MPGPSHERSYYSKQAQADREARRKRISDLRLAASGMRYFGDYTEAEALEAEAARMEGK